ncbi:MAG: hypothetical protein GY765_06040, partial [bacterium]|nr:hypothetical protein [bacterium]
MNKIAICYSRKDSLWIDRLEPYLRNLGLGESVSVWTDVKPSSEEGRLFEDALKGTE